MCGNVRACRGEFIPVGNMPQQVAKPASLGFVELDAYALSVVRPVAAARASYGDGSTIIPLFSNYGFLPFLRNLLCSFHRLRVQNFIVIAMDNERARRCRRKGRRRLAGYRVRVPLPAVEHGGDVGYPGYVWT